MNDNLFWRRCIFIGHERNQNPVHALLFPFKRVRRALTMSSIIYLVGLVVIVLAILSFLGLG